MLLVNAAEMRALDREVIDRIGVPGIVLMETAGRAVLEVIAGLVRCGPHLRVLVLSGPGNNGGDGFVVARHLHNRGAEVGVVLCTAESKIAGDARVHLEACRRSGVELLDGASSAALAEALGRYEHAQVVVDALLGTGLTREVNGLLAEAVQAINGHTGIKISVDIPSGLDSDRGVPLGACVRADHTVTFAFAKLGLCAAPGFTFAGQLHVADIGVPERLARAHGVRAELLEAGVLAPLARLDPLAHKGSRGHLLVVAGSPGKTGAALLCGGAALRAGAGLVTLALPGPAQRSVDGRVPELMTVSYGDPEGKVDPGEDARALGALLPGRRALAIGPGVPTATEFRPLLGELLRRAAELDLGVVLDADALNHLAADPDLLEGIDPEWRARRMVLTPHPGEAARLTGRSTREVQGDRVKVARALALRLSAVVALKGARTVVASPGGALAICPTGGPGLATAGTGDVLTGCVGARLAAGAESFAAACEAVYLHGAAGDLASDRRGVPVAGDVIEALGEVIGRAR